MQYFDPDRELQPSRPSGDLSKVIGFMLDVESKENPYKARRREEIAKELFLPFCRSLGITTAVSPYDCVKYEEALRLPLKAEVDHHGSYRRYASQVQFGGVQRINGVERHALLFEMLSEVGSPHFGISTSQPYRRQRLAWSVTDKHMPPNPAVEELSSAACEVFFVDPKSPAVLDVTVLMTADAFDQARLRLQKIKTEVDIWRVNSPFASDTLFTEQSALVRLALSEVNRQVTREQASTINKEDGDTMILGFLSFHHDDYANQIKIQTIVASIIGDPVQSALALWRRESTIDFTRYNSGQVVAKETAAREYPVSPSERAAFNEQLRENKHLGFLRNPQYFKLLQGMPRKLFDQGFIGMGPDFSN